MDLIRVEQSKSRKNKTAIYLSSTKKSKAKPFISEILSLDYLKISFHIHCLRGIKNFSGKNP